MVRIEDFFRGLTERRGRDGALGRDGIRATVRRLRERGVQIHVYANEYDPVVMVDDASVSEVTRLFRRGIALPTVREMLKNGHLMEWIDATQRNHTLITHVQDDNDEAASQLRTLCADLAIRCAP
jgi:hypothetical protein